MMTNTKLLQEITSMTTENNKILREQLKKQILDGIGELNNNIVQDFSEKYTMDFDKLIEQFNCYYQNLLNEIDNRHKKLNEEFLSSVNKIINKSNKSTLDNIILEYNSKIEQLNSEFDKKINYQSETILCMIKTLSDNINSLQKDNAIVMETLQLILTNLIINGVDRK